MAHYAYINENNIVTQVIVGRDEGELGIDWEGYYGAKRTSYNTHGNNHPSGNPFRYNFAGVGFSFDPSFGEDGAFIAPKPFPSWTINLQTALWEAPTPMPLENGPWHWNEEILNWQQEIPQ